MKVKEMISAYSSMVFGKNDYWHPEMFASSKIKKDKIGEYYVDTRAKSEYPGNYDENEIPLVNLNGEDTYIPVTIAQYALGNYDRFIDTNDIKYIQIVKKCADWFIDNIIELGINNKGYIHNNNQEIYKIQAPWFSALAQAQAISVLSRYYNYSKDKKYLDSALELLKSFEVNVADGGIFNLLNENYFYEEYPSKTPSYVLNGFIFSLWGLLDLYIVSNNSKAKELYDNGIITLKNNIHLYNIKWLGWSRYDLYPFKIKNITSIFYHKLHVEQLKAMYRLTDLDIFKFYYSKWEKSSKNIIKYLIATSYKVIHKLSVAKGSTYVPSIKNEEK